MNVYLGLFVIAFSALALEITLVRLLSVTTWYHLAFFAISAAMLGMTAGATRVFLQPRTFQGYRLQSAISVSCVHFALSVPVTLIVLCLVPLGLNKSIMSLIALFVTTAICALPFYFVGTVVSAVLTKYRAPMGKLYASDLIGASLGCLFVLGGLELLDAPSLILLCGSSGGFAGLCFSWGSHSRSLRRLCLSVAIALLAAGILNSFSSRGIRPVVVKGSRIEPAVSYHTERWNSFSRVAVYPRAHAKPQYWGPSPMAPMDPVYHYRMNIDGEAGTYLRRFRKKDDIEHLRYDVTNVAYYLGRRGATCIIGAGAGRDIQSAILFGQKPIEAVEINPILVDLLCGEFREFAGIADHPDVHLVTAEARGHLSRSQDKYSVIQMSLIDTWAATGAGAFSLSENSLYTVEAWELFLDRLDGDGIFTVSRWHSPDHIGETGRVLSLAVSALIVHGAKSPSDHLALVTAGNISTLLICKSPFSDMDVAQVSDTCDQLDFRAVLLPNHLPDDHTLRDIVSARTREQLSSAVKGTHLNFSPPTDESPYFFNMLRLRNIAAAMKRREGVVSGNLVATLTLIGLLLALLVLTLATVVLPLALRRRFNVDAGTVPRTICSGAVYFSLVGAGFMLTEIALIQRLNVLLSHPIFALGILLFTLIASTGIGSLLSDRLPLSRAPWLYVYPILTAVCLVGLRYVLGIALEAVVAESLLKRIAVSVALIFPIGLLMGVFFPTGMRLAKASSSAETPWYWALNGVFGVLCSALAVLVSIYVGISSNLYLGAVCYGSAVLALHYLARAPVLSVGDSRPPAG
jgi:hypothetical protein